MAIEKIDDAGTKEDTFTELVSLIVGYLNNPSPALKDRLQVERKIKEYQDRNTQDWLLNLMIAVHKKQNQTKESSLRRL